MSVEHSAFEKGPRVKRHRGCVRPQRGLTRRVGNTLHGALEMKEVLHASGPGVLRDSKTADNRGSVSRDTQRAVLCPPLMCFHFGKRFANHPLNMCGRVRAHVHFYRAYGRVPVCLCVDECLCACMWHVSRLVTIQCILFIYVRAPCVCVSFCVCVCAGVCVCACVPVYV